MIKKSKGTVKKIRHAETFSFPLLALEHAAEPCSSPDPHIKHVHHGTSYLPPQQQLGILHAECGWW